MSTWQLFSDAGNNFRWEITDHQLRKEQCDVVDQQLINASCSKLVENEKDNIENPPMFRTGLGKSVSLKQSSIAKARSVLGDVDDLFTDTGQLDGREIGHDFLKPRNGTGSLRPAIKLKSGMQNPSNNVVNLSNSMFQTGSGKAVNISSAGLLRAKTLLGLEENYCPESLHGSTKTQMQSTSTEHPPRENPSHLENEGPTNLNYSSSTVALASFGVTSNTLGSESKDFPDFMNTTHKPPPVKFQTAGGRSISVSSDALQRARSLLGNTEFDSFLNEGSSADSVFPVIDDRKPSCSSSTNIGFSTPFSCKRAENGDNSLRNFTSPLRLSSYQKHSLGRFEKPQLGNNLITKFDEEAANDTHNRPYNGITCNRNPIKKERVDCLENGIQSKIDSSKRSSNGALVDISNTINTDRIDKNQYSGEKKRLGRISSASPFKKPRNSFVTPLNKNNSAIIALSRLATKEPSCKERVSMRYPIQVPRAYLKEYVLQSPSIQGKLENLPKYIRQMNPNSAESYIFQNEPASGYTGTDAFHKMLTQSGASNQYLTKEWVLNHYKWIVWKLASYERCYPATFSGKLLTVSNVLEELKYRYEREVNHGHRSAIKKILDGDAPPSSMMVLCISSVDDTHERELGSQSVSLEGGGDGRAAKIELTDGWYSVKALLDDLLSQKLASGKLFLGQKIRIWGAKFCGWVGPISPFEASRTAALSLHINGIYRCHWAEKLGFCKSAGVPLAFKCIKATGGTVPSTLVGITRIYPVLYKERLTTGSFIVRSERVEAKVLQLYNQRRSAVAEEVMSRAQRELGDDFDGDHDCEEGAKIMKLLETAAEPEVLMAGMSSKQLTSFASYKAKLEADRQSDMQKSIEKALEEAGLSERDVTPFLRVRVVGLANNSHPQKYFPREGLITIWNPTEKQKLELCEGQAYGVGGLLPSSSDSGTLYLQARGSSTNWIPLSPLIMENFVPFFTPRSATAISNLGEVSLCSEFDIAALVVYVGEVYMQGHQQKQWVFVTDGSTPQSCSKESSDTLLAISFSLPFSQCDSFSPVNSNIAGSVVGFCNLIKRPRDQVNGLWVADATENSDYFLSYDHASRNHLKDAAASVFKWAKTSSLITEKLKENILSIIRNSKDGC
ncbi:hypothetical protein RD792_013891 [Penstemon davidsonii]|uniref:Tower domain-containing protein n=1 Tax=Penstemon davidsonii TaxID=160366 RepID=A0ABR0CPI6_9LAMI|nr:hypothetical protein RD792_013891 [Penstemon davidsonii]